MKIGILTQPLHNNYGGLLQNYALQQVLKGMGHEVETVDWMPASVGAIKTWLWRKKETLLSIVLKDREKPGYSLTDKEKEIISRNTHRFIERYISVCPSIAKNEDEFRSIDEAHKYQAYVVGSDQVWRPNYNPFQTAMFLDFVERKDVKRIAYAASFGTSVWEFSTELTEECAQLAKKFDLITIREKSGVDLCKRHLGVEATWVLDPTMLLGRKDYERVVMAENEPVSKGTLFHYILDPSDEKEALIERMSANLGLNSFTIMPKCQAENRTKWDVKNRIEDCIFPSVTSWLRGFMDAEMVIIDSFHGAVFSIIFNKPFWVIANSKRGNARFESLLEMYGLEDRMIASGDTIDWKKEINWNRVNEIREKEKEKSLKCLDAFLSK